MQTVERYIIDLEGLGNQFYDFLFGHLHSQEWVKFVYHESFAQMVMAMDNDKQEFELRLASLPDLSLFQHLEPFQNEIILSNYLAMFKQIGLQLCELVYRHTNPIGYRAQYFSDAVTLTYIVIVKTVNNEPMHYQNANIGQYHVSF